MLGYSQMLYVEFAARQIALTVMLGLERAFAAFGRVPRAVLFDQMKGAVVEDHRPTGGRLLSNPEFLLFAAHWGFRIQACRPCRAKTEGKVERPVGDTNVFVGAVATRGLSADLLVVLPAEHDLVLGETVLTELRQVLARKIRLPKETIRELDAFLSAQATVAPPATNAAHPWLQGAGGADVLVTDDRVLLGVSDTPLEVVSPRSSWERLRSPRKRLGRAT